MEPVMLTSLTLGFTIGLMHAFDPDHLVAMSTMVSRERSIRRSSMLGAMWGLGHTTSLALMGLAVLALQLTIPPSLSKGMEFAVAMMIVALGGHLIWRTAKDLKVHKHSHFHDDSPTHAHVHLHNQSNLTDQHHHVPRSNAKTFAIGIIHGLAGSAALTLAVMATMTSTMQGVLYILIFGLGSIGGMLLMSAIMSMPFAFLGKWVSGWQRPAQGMIGMLAVSFGLYFGWSVALAS